MMLMTEEEKFDAQQIRIRIALSVRATYETVWEAISCPSA